MLFLSSNIATRSAQIFRTVLSHRKRARTSRSCRTQHPADDEPADTGIELTLERRISPEKSASATSTSTRVFSVTLFAGSSAGAPQGRSSKPPADIKLSGPPTVDPLPAGIQNGLVHNQKSTRESTVPAEKASGTHQELEVAALHVEVPGVEQPTTCDMLCRGTAHRLHARMRASIHDVHARASARKHTARRGES